MFIRRTITSRSETGTYATYRLVKGIREGNRVRQITLLNLGSDFCIPREQWSDLVDVIEGRLNGHPEAADPCPDLTRTAEGIVRRLRQRELERLGTSDSKEVAATFDPNGVSVEDVRSVGCERIALDALSSVGFTNILTEFGMTNGSVQMAAAVVIACMVHPSNQKETTHWLQKNSSVLELVGLDQMLDLKLTKICRVSDALYALKEKIQVAMATRLATLHSSPPKAAAFYDFTRTFKTSNPETRVTYFGLLKQKFTDTPVVTLALALDKDGFPLRSSIRPGKLNLPGTLAAALEKISSQAELESPAEKRPTVVINSEIATDDNLALLKERCFNYIILNESAPNVNLAVDGDEGKHQFSKANEPSLAVTHLQLRRKKQEVRLIVGGKAQRKREKKRLRQQVARFEAKLTKLNENLNRQRSEKRFEKIVQRIDRLRKRNPLLHPHYNIVVSTRQCGKVCSIVWGRRSCPFVDYIMRTDHTEWNADDTLGAYRTLMQIHENLRCVHSDLIPHPVLSKNVGRIEGRFFVTVLALFAVQLIRYRLVNLGINAKWSDLRNKLSGWQRINITIPITNTKRIHIRQDTRPDSEAREIGMAAGVSFSPNRQIRQQSVAALLNG